MRKTFVGLVAAALAAVVVTVAPAVGAPSESGPRCADITAAGGLTYSGGTMSGSYLVGAPACKQITYVLVVESTVGTTTTTTELIGTPSSGNPNLILFSGSIADDDGIVCVSGETRTNGGKVFDRAPDTGCVQVSSGSGGVGGFN